MAVPSSVGSRRDTLEKAWRRYMETWGALKVKAQEWVAKSAAGPVLALEVASLSTTLANYSDDLIQIASIGQPLADYGQAQLRDPTLNLSNEHSTSLAQLTATRVWIYDHFPKDGTGALQVVAFDVAGRKVDLTFSSAQLAEFRDVLTALIAVID